MSPLAAGIYLDAPSLRQQPTVGYVVYHYAVIRGIPGMFRFIPGGTGTDDGWTVIVPADAGGVWVLDPVVDKGKDITAANGYPTMGSCLVGVYGGRHRTIPAGTLTGNITIGLDTKLADGVATAPDGSQIELTRYDSGPDTVSVTSGSGGPVVTTLPMSVPSWALFEMAGGTWREREAGLLTLQVPATVAYAYSPAASGDDSAAIAALFSAGWTWVQLAPGTYTFATPLRIPSNCRLSGYGATVNSTIVNQGFPSDCSIYIDVAPNASVGSTTLASTPGANATSISMAAAPTQGQVIALAHGTSYDVFQAGAVTGSGPYTVPLLDDNGQPRALRWPFVSGDTVQVYKAGARPHDILVEGIIFTGTGVQCVEVARALRVVFSDCIFQPAANVTGHGQDEGCEDCWAIRCHAYLSGGGSQVAYYAQSNIDGGFVDCTAEGNQNGISLLDCYGTVVRGGRVQGVSGYGVLATSLPNLGVSSFGCLNCIFDQVSVFDCPTGFIIIGATGQTLSGCFADACSTNGFAVTTHATTPTADRTTLTGCRTRNCGTDVLISSTITNTTLRDFATSGTTVGALGAAGDVVVEGFTALGLAVQAITTTCANARLSQLNVSVLPGLVAIQLAGANAWITDSVVTSPTSVCYYETAGRVGLRDCKAVGSGGSTAVYVSAGCTANLVGTNDLDGAATPFINLGTMTAVQAGGESTLAVTNADVTMTWAQAEMQGLTTSGVLTGNHLVFMPKVAGMAWDVFNNNSGSFTTTFTTSGGTGIAPAQGKRQRLKCDGTNIVAVTAAF